MTRRRWHATLWSLVFAVVAGVAAVAIHLATGAAAAPRSTAATAPAITAPTVSASTNPPPTLSPDPLPSPSAKPTVSPSPRASTATLAPGSLVRSGGHLSVAVFDRTTGRGLVSNGSERFHTASIVKVDILATLLWQDQRAGRAMTAAQRQTAYQMITVSDNAAADAMWARIGRGAGLAAANRTFGLTHTTPGSTSAHPWGQTLTTATDQLRLLEVITESGGPLTSASRAYILSLMAQVTSGQRWGVPAAGRHTTKVYVKDGWLSQQSDHWQWIVNSIGRLVEPGHDYLVVTLSDHQSTESSGIAAIQRLATTACTRVSTQS